MSGGKSGGIPPEPRARVDSNLPLRDSLESFSGAKAPSNHARVVGFDKFWSAYPHKVGKDKAIKAFRSALERMDNFDPLGVLLVSLGRYKSEKPSDRPWCNPATWLNEGRWMDGEGPAPPSLEQLLDPAQKAEHERKMAEFRKKIKALKENENGSAHHGQS